MKQTNVKPADGKLGIMVVGCGAVATTFMTGVLMTRRGLAKPVGSMNFHLYTSPSPRGGLLLRLPDSAGKKKNLSIKQPGAA